MVWVTVCLSQPLCQYKPIVLLVFELLFAIKTVIDKILSEYLFHFIFKAVMRFVSKVWILLHMTERNLVSYVIIEKAIPLAVEYTTMLYLLCQLLVLYSLYHLLSSVILPIKSLYLLIQGLKLCLSDSSQPFNII